MSSQSMSYEVIVSPPPVFKVGDTFRWKKHTWKIETLSVGTTYSGNKANEGGICVITCKSILKDGSQGKYSLKSSFIPTDKSLYEIFESGKMFPFCMITVNRSAGKITKRNQERKIVGEYDIVVRLTTQYDLLKKYHATPMTKEDAYFLIKDLCILHGISFYDMIIHWGNENSGRGGHRYVDNRRVGYISLPSKTAKVGDINQNLRIGLVLHEFAHVIIHMKKINTREKRKNQHHGIKFCEIFDELMVYYHKKYESGEKI